MERTGAVAVDPDLKGKKADQRDQANARSRKSIRRAEIGSVISDTDPFRVYTGRWVFLRQNFSQPVFLQKAGNAMFLKTHQNIIGLDVVGERPVQVDISQHQLCLNHNPRIPNERGQGG